MNTILTEKRRLSSSAEMISLPVSKKMALTPKGKLLPAQKLALIPQLGSTCWFNIILTVILYSQMARKIIYEEAFNWISDDESFEELKENKFKRFLFYMLKYNYTNPEKIEQLFRGRIKPELLLFSFIEQYDFTDIREHIKIGISTDVNKLSFYLWYFTVIIGTIFRNQNDVINLFYYRGQLYIENSNLIGLTENPPKIIALINEKIFDFRNLVEDFHQVSAITLGAGIADYEDEITFNGLKYKLDASLMSNYRKSKETPIHFICGITYDNKGYVYNGWVNKNDKEDLFPYYHQKKKSNCPLFPRDWKSDLRKEEYSAGFCLPTSIISNCVDLAELDENKMCFDFSVNTNNNKILIYVLKEEGEEGEEKEQSSPLLDSLITIDELVYKSASVSPLIRKFYDFENKTTEELQALLAKIYGETLNVLLNKLNSIKVFYFILTGKRLTKEAITGNRNEVLRKIFMALLKIYVKDDNLIRFGLITDDKIHINLKQTQILELGLKIGYTRRLLEGLLGIGTGTGTGTGIGNIIFEEYLILYHIIFKHSTIDKSSNLFVFVLCKFFIIHGKKIEIGYYSDRIVEEELLSTPLNLLKSKGVLKGDKELLNLIIPIESEEDFKEAMKIPSNEALVIKFISSSEALYRIQMRLKEKAGTENSFKILLILMIIEQQSLLDFYNTYKPPPSSTIPETEVSMKGGNRKLKKKLRSYL